MTTGLDTMQHQCVPPVQKGLLRAIHVKLLSSSWLAFISATPHEDDYYAQYDSVQPAMDNHDPDEEVERRETTPPLGLSRPSNSADADPSEVNETSGAWTLAEPPPDSPSLRSNADREQRTDLIHPRPESPARLERFINPWRNSKRRPGSTSETEFGVKQHISRSMGSLFLLSRTAGIDRDEFERMVRTELDVLAMVEEDI